MRVVLLALPIALFLAASAGAQERITWRPCEPAVERARCGVMPVQEDRNRSDSRTIFIAFAVIPALQPDPSDDPVLILLGGPGDAPGRRLAALALAHAALNVTRDLILVDQRGTGASSQLACYFGSDDDLQGYMNEFVPLASVRDCLLALKGDADLTRYRTRDFVADLEELRSALDIAQWNLHGVSYGTRVALHYLARHPAAIRSAVLLAVVPPELAMPVSFGEDADRAFAMVMADCHADSVCATAFPRIAEEMDSVVRRLSGGPVATQVAHPVTGAPTPVRLSRGTYGEVIRALMYTPEGARALPLTIHEAFLGDYRAIAAVALRRQRNMARAGWAGLYLAVTCPEDIARAGDPERIYARHVTTTLGDARARQHFGACDGWPLRPDGEEWPTGRITPPVLMIVGEQDPVTPPRWAELAMRTAANARLVIIPQGGHGLAGMTNPGCLASLQRSFLETPRPADLDATCAAKMRRLPFLTSR